MPHLGPLVSIGWSAVKVKPNEKWVAVKDARVPKSATALRSMGGIHSFTRSKIKYQRETGDTWQKPGDTLALGHGDCEDICILERALLINAGYKDENIELMIVRDLVTQEDHALLWVKEHYLDNRTDKVLHVSQFKDYRPISGHRKDESFIYGRIK